MLLNFAVSNTQIGDRCGAEPEYGKRSKCDFRGDVHIKQERAPKTASTCDPNCPNVGAAQHTMEVAILISEQAVELQWPTDQHHTPRERVGDKQQWGGSCSRIVDNAQQVQ